MDVTRPDAMPAGPVVSSGGTLDHPIVLLDLDDLRWDELGPSSIVRAVGDGRIVLGFATRPPPDELARALDLTVVPPGHDLPPWLVGSDEPGATADRIARHAAAHPHAARTAAELVRLHADAPERPLSHALATESYAYSMLLASPEFSAWLASRRRRDVPWPLHDVVSVTRRGDSLEVRLDHAARRNAYGARLRDALVDALGIALHDDTITQVTLSGAGPTFSAGGDLDEFGTTPHPAYGHLVRTTAGAAPTMHALGARLRVLVHGPCIGAGVELPAFAQHVVADPGTTFRLPEIAMGLVPGAGGTVSVTRRIGRWRSAYLALAGTAIDADTALRWGLVDEIGAVAP